ncbi:ATP-binding protein [Agromyces tardus]|jgi:signal transduction histidine kinase|uniref:ATP-binding protein n=1 Tax=Agromyces tardus TaxID=2583849 RepID=A0A3M8A531_9MICO|nr:ATP-binding protein [Agromyces tardus]RNB46294.1 ATP-binding protein [Agromyces tardus]
MNLGLPEHLARESFSRALANAGHCAALVCLVIGIVVVAESAFAGGAEGELAAVMLLAAQALLLVLVARFPTVTLTVVYLVAGSAVVFALTVLVMQPENGVDSTNNPLLALPRIALLLVGGAGAGSAIALTWATLGFGLGEAATFLGAAIGGGSWVPNVAAAGAFGLLVMVRAYDGLSRRRDTRKETGLHRASQQTRELALRHDYELRATARLHDTALSHLVAIAAAGSGPIDERLRVGIRQDLGLIVGRDWAIDHGDAAIDDGAFGSAGAAGGAGRPGRSGGNGPIAAAATRTVLPEALEAARNAGLGVRITGDPAALEVLGPVRASVLDAAVAQCLVNVARHAGVGEAEVAIGPGHGDVTVVVVDSGLGFDVDAVPDDRIGLRTSIRARIEQEGGSVQVWSSPGVGTTVVLTVPEGGA